MRRYQKNKLKYLDIFYGNLIKNIFLRINYLYIINMNNINIQNQNIRQFFSQKYVNLGQTLVEVGFQILWVH